MNVKVRKIESHERTSGWDHAGHQALGSSSSSIGLLVLRLSPQVGAGFVQEIIVTGCSLGCLIRDCFVITLYKTILFVLHCNSQITLPFELPFILCYLFGLKVASYIHSLACSVGSYGRTEAMNSSFHIPAEYMKTHLLPLLFTFLIAS